MSHQTKEERLREELQYEVMEDYVRDATLLSDGGARREYMRAHFDNLVAFILKKLSEEREDLLRMIDQVASESRTTSEKYGIGVTEDSARWQMALDLKSKLNSIDIKIEKSSS